MTTTNFLLLFREIIAAYSENHTKHINTLCGQNAELLNVAWGMYAFRYNFLTLGGSATPLE
jgi:hypothetical protein